MCDFITQSSTLPFLEQCATSVILCSESDTWELTEGCGEKGNILSSKLERNLLRNCISMCECNSQSYTFLFSVQFANTVFWKSAMGYFWTQRSLPWQRNILKWKRERSFLRIYLLMYVFISQSYPYFSCSIPLTLSLRNLRNSSLDHFQAYTDKGNIISSKGERSFLRKLFGSVNSSHRVIA